MNYTNINLVAGTKVTVISDIHGHSDQFLEIIEKVKPGPKSIVVSLGDIKDKGFGPEAETKILHEIKRICDLGYGYVVKGNHELKHLKNAKKENRMTDDLRWVDAWPLCVSFQFISSRNRLTVVHAGVKPSHTWNDLQNNTDVAYIRTLDENGEYIKLVWVVDKDGKKDLKPEKIGRPWGEFYTGKYGYICAGHDAQKDGIPKFWPHCCNIDTAVYHTGILTAQVFSEFGREELVQVTGKAAKPVLW